MLLHLRHEITEASASSSERVAFKMWAAVMKGAGRYRLSARLLRLVQKIFGTLPVNKWTATRDLPPLAATSFRELWPTISQSQSGKE
jgi:hypothetical protein